MKTERFFHDTLREIWRYPFRMSMKKRNRNGAIRILSSNCIGGVLLHDLCLPFNSPTVNTIINDMDFIHLCTNPEAYMREEPEFDRLSEYGFPIAKLADIKIHCVHYKSFEQFKEQWTRRSQRFLAHEADDILIMATDSQIKTEDSVEAFRKLPYRKICFTAKRDIPYEEFIYIPGFENGVTGDLTRYIDFKGTRIFEKYFDCVKWLNYRENNTPKT